MFMLNVEFPTPTNFACDKCVSKSGIYSELPTRVSPTKTILQDLTVSDVIVCEKRLRGKVPQKSKDSDRRVQVYK